MAHTLVGKLETVIHTCGYVENGAAEGLSNVKGLCCLGLLHTSCRFAGAGSHLLCSNTPVVHCSFQLHTQQSTIGLYSLTLDSSLWCLSIRSVADWEGEDEDK